MKIRTKAFLCLLLTLAMTSSVLLVSCGKNEGGDSGTSVTDGSGTNDNGITALNYDFDLSKYVKVGKYVGVEVTLEKPSVTKEEIDSKIENILVSNADISYEYEGTVKNGDMISIDYAASKDGNAIDEMKGDGISITVGKNTFIKEFEDALVGVKIGDTATFDITFGDDGTEYANQTVNMQAKVNSKIIMTPLELNADTIDKLTDCDTEDEWRTVLEKEILEEKYTAQNSQKLDAVWKKVTDSSEIISYPDEPMKYYTNEYIKYYTDLAAEANTPLESYLLEKQDMTMEQFNTEAKAYAESYVLEDLIFNTIVKEQKLTISENEYAAGVQKYFEYYSNYGFKTPQEFVDYYTESSVRTSLLWDKMIAFLGENAVVVNE